jgi:flagellar biosynthetic protein FlhB
MSESAGEKSFAPSQKRLDNAAREGDVLRSRDMATAAGLLGGVALLKLVGPWLLDSLASGLRSGLSWDRPVLDDFAPGALLLRLGAAALAPVLVLGGGVVVLTLAVQLGLAGPGRFTPGNLAPRGSRLDPLQGLGRMFGPQGWIELGKGLAKVGLLGAIAWSWGRGRMLGLMQLWGAGLAGQVRFGWQALTSLLFALCAGLVVIALIDWPIQWWRRQLRLKMSLQELRDEQKEADGAPEKKQAIRQRQRQIAMGGVAAAMRKAQFVITNPTHFAVAMAYDPELAPAPVVLAKGRGDKALAMRELAAELELPCLEYPALARSVFYTTRERQMIREELYGAVASVLAFVLSLKRGEARAAPAIDVPVALRFDAEGRLDTPAP